MSFKEWLFAAYGVVVLAFRKAGLYPDTNNNFWFVDDFLKKILG